MISFFLGDGFKKNWMFVSGVRKLKLLSFFLIFSLFFFLSAFSYSAVSFTKENLYQLGMLAARDGAYERAIDFFNKAIELDPRFSPAYNGLGIIYETGPLADISVAVRYFQLAVDVAPENVESLNNLGRAQYAAGEFVKAEKTLLKSLVLFPGQPDIEISLAWNYLLGQSRPEEALPFFSKNATSQGAGMLYYGIGLVQLVLNKRFEVMDAITSLRHYGREDLAAKLEDMLKKNVKFLLRPGLPMIPGNEGERSVFSEELKAMDGARVDADTKVEGIQVRLRGPLTR